ncbi:MAG: hypothetical protein AAF892_00395 [Cyanobacteria bacterium P01_D01_bin.71]
MSFEVKIQVDIGLTTHLGQGNLINRLQAMSVTLLQADIGG